MGKKEEGNFKEGKLETISPHKELKNTKDLDLVQASKE